MCTSFYIESESEEMRSILSRMRRSPLVNRFIKAGDRVYTSGAIIPSRVTPGVASNKAGNIGFFPMKWGLERTGKPALTEVDVENAAEDPLLREAWKQHRCILPAAWYYEQMHIRGIAGRVKTGASYAVQPAGADMTYLCGIYNIVKGFPVFAVLLRESAGQVRRLHTRMPLIMPAEKVRQWISPVVRPEELLSFALTDMVAEKAE